MRTKWLKKAKVLDQSLGPNLQHSFQYLVMRESIGPFSRAKDRVDLSAEFYVKPQ